MNPSSLAKHEALYSTTGGKGHLIDKHVGKTVQQLIDRFEHDPEISASSSFSDIKIAEKAVDMAIQTIPDKIQRLKDGIQHSTQADINLYPNIVGIVVDKSGKSTSTTKFRLIIVADVSAKHGYYILTGYPLP